MSTETRLNKLFHTSPVIPYDCLSRFVIMSGCHQGAGGRGEIFLKNETIYSAALKYYYNNNFTYIELGDRDELWENRNTKEIITARDGLILKNRINGHSIFLIHGHQGSLISDILWKFSRFFVRYIWRPTALFALNGSICTAKSSTKKSAVEQRLFTWASSHSQMLITGHTHHPVFPESDTSFYFSCGGRLHLHCVTALEISDEKITLVRWSTDTGRDMGIYIRREVLAGPLCLPLS